MNKLRLRGSMKSSRSKASVLGISVAVSGLILAACGSSSSGASSNSSTSNSAAPATTSANAAAAAYFKGKTITLIAPDNPGGGFDQYARIVAPALAKYLGATVNVENVNGGGTVVGTNQMAAASPDGLTLSVVNTGGDIASLIEKQPGQNFDLSKLSWVGQAGSSPSVLITSPNSGVTSFSQLLTVKTPIKVVDVRNGTGDMFNRIVLGAFNIPHTFITGFTSTGTLKQGFLAGDGQYAFENMPTFLSMLNGGQAKALLVTTKPTLPVLVKAAGTAVTLSQALSSATLTAPQTAAIKEAIALSSLDYDFAGPPGIPAARLAVLRDAFQKAVADPTTVAQATKEGEPLNFIDGASVATQVTAAITNGAAISAYVNG